MGMYDPLETFLSNHVDDECVLTHADIEKIIRKSLPQTAKTTRQWWGNEGAGTHVQADSWMHAGWKVADGCEPERGRVRFVRSQATSPFEHLHSEVRSTQMLLLLAIPSVARRPLVQRLVDVAADLAEGDGPRNLTWKRNLREARCMEELLEIGETFEAKVEGKARPRTA